MTYSINSSSVRCRCMSGILPTLLLLWMYYTLTSNTVVVAVGLNTGNILQNTEGVTENERWPPHPNEISNPLEDVESSSLSLLSLAAVETEVSVWPFSHHDSNNSNSNSSNNNNNNQTSDDSNKSKDKVCNDATTCDRCNSYYTCHWCAHDSTCHAIGSVYGCMMGSSCANQKKPNIDPNDTVTGCSAHTTCRNCTLSSSLCHWCGHDNMCHAVGSVYGCITGVDCYDNQHCQRTIPEPIPTHRQSKQHDSDKSDTDVPIYHRNIGILPLVLILSISGIMLCCSTSCCCIMNCLKGAYDDLAIATMIPQAHQYNSIEHDTDEYSPLLQEETIPLSTVSQQSGDDNFFDCHTSTVDATTTTAATTTTTSSPASSAKPKDTDAATATDIEGQTQPLLETTTTATNDDSYRRMVDGDEENNNNHDSSPTTTTTTTSHGTTSNRNDVPTVTTFLHRRATRPHQQQQRRFVAMQRLYTTCMGCYVGNVLFIGFFTYIAIYYFPQKPIYNICNDSVAWKSLIDSMTSFKATAEFQILASVYNPNALDVALDMGKGSFAHNGEMVGTYEIPPTLIASQAITDLLIVARFTPEKWQALSITAEYYSGNLVLHVNADASIRIPALFDYTISTSLQDIVVHVNALSDRHLCSCPTWSNNNGTSYFHHQSDPLEL